MFALSQADNVHWQSALTGFLILHLLIFPSSNGYNSYQDHDTGSIGGIKHPPGTTVHLLYATILFDFAGIACSFLISAYFSLLVLIFVIMSHAYSYRKIRLKRKPVLAFFTVFIFQGAFVYLTSSFAISPSLSSEFMTTKNILCMLVSSLFIGSIYPLTQIYQHESDKNDGVISLSYKLGYTGTFVFSAALFSIASLLLFYYFKLKHQAVATALFFLIMLPVIFRLTVWFKKVRQNFVHADYENAMNLNFLTSACMNLFFLVLIINNHLAIF